MNIDEILKNNGLDFHIDKIPLAGIEGLGNIITSNYYGLVNSKTQEIIHVVKKGYVVSQNKEILERVIEGIEPFSDKISVYKAGSLSGGRKVYIQLKIEGESIVGYDTIQRYITIIDSNDGSTSLSFGTGDLTMSCKNQFYKFHKLSENKFRHSIQLEQKMKTIPSLIEISLKNSMKMIERYKLYQSTPVTKEMANQLVFSILGFDKVLSPKELLIQKSTAAINKMNTIYENINHEIANKGKNLWGLHSGITRFTTHDLSVSKKENGKIESLLNGSAYNINQKSINFAESILV